MGHFEGLQEVQERESVILLSVPGYPEEIIDLKEVAPAMARVGEVALLTGAADAQRLADALDEAYKALGQIQNRVNYLLDRVKASTKRKWDELLLDFVPGALSDRKIKDSTDNRNALVRTHEEYQQAQSLEAHMEWVSNDLRIKRERVYGAKRTCLAVIGERSYHRGSASGGSSTKYGGR